MWKRAERYGIKKEIERLARDLKIKIKVPVKPILERSGYRREVERAVKILKAAGFRQDDIKRLVKHLNLSEETTEFIARIEKAIPLFTGNLGMRYATKIFLQRI